MMAYLSYYICHLIYSKMTRLTEFFIIESDVHTHFHPPLGTKDSVSTKQNMKPLHILS